MADKEEDTIDPRKERALADGWTPKDEWKGETNQWVDYEQFNIRGELMGRIREQSGIINSNKNRMDDMQKAITDLVDMNNKKADVEYKRILKNLQTEKAKAIEESDGEAVVQIDSDIAALKEHQDSTTTKPDMKPETDQPEENPDVTAWMEAADNQWFNNDKAMRDAATGIAQSIVAADKELPPKKVLEKMTKQMKELMPHKFKGRSPVDGGDGNGGKPLKDKARTFSELSDDEKAVARRFERTGVMSIKDYIAKLDELED